MFPSEGFIQWLRSTGISITGLWRKLFRNRLILVGSCLRSVTSQKRKDTSIMTFQHWNIFDQCLVFVSISQEPCSLPTGKLHVQLNILTSNIYHCPRPAFLHISVFTADWYAPLQNCSTQFHDPLIFSILYFVYALPHRQYSQSLLKGITLSPSCSANRLSSSDPEGPSSSISRAYMVHHLPWELLTHHSSSHAAFSSKWYGLAMNIIKEKDGVCLFICI